MGSAIRARGAQLGPRRQLPCARGIQAGRAGTSALAAAAPRPSRAASGHASRSGGQRGEQAGEEGIAAAHRIVAVRGHRAVPGLAAGVDEDHAPLAERDDDGVAVAAGAAADRVGRLARLRDAIDAGHLEELARLRGVDLDQIGPLSRARARSGPRESTALRAPAARARAMSSAYPESPAAAGTEPAMASHLGPSASSSSTMSASPAQSSAVARMPSS